MAAVLNSQLDFIFFFYGFAFILLGATCFAVRGRTPGEVWTTLGLFGFVHGATEWLDLSALVIGDAPVFAVIRTAVMTASYIFLLEFARQLGVRRGLKLPGRWIYVPLLGLVALGGLFGGVVTANVLARYFIGFVGALGSALLFLWRPGALVGPTRGLAVRAAVALALYGIMAGAIVPAAPFWPASVFNHAWFIQTTGLPVQLVRGLLACWIAYSVWAIWFARLAEQVSSERYSAYLRRQFAWTLVAMAAVLSGGWLLTEYLGGLYKYNVQQQANGDIDLLASRLSGETATVNGMVKALAGSRSVRNTVLGGSEEDRERAQFVLDVDVDAAGAARGYILNREGVVVAQSGPDGSAGPAAGSFRDFPFFHRVIAGDAGRAFTFDPATGSRDFLSSYPIRGTGGKVVGAAVLQRSLAAFEADLQKFDRPYFLVDGDGIAMLTNQPAMMLRPLWPLSAERKAARVAQLGKLNGDPLLTSEIADATWVTINGTRDYVRRRYAQDSAWSLVMLKPTREIFASRIIGIVITLLVTIMALIYLSGRERSVHDQVQMDKRLELQDLARNLRFQATTDPLTGLHNRLRFNQALEAEIIRAARYKAPFAVILFDVDHFKQVNDTHGHQIGDRVLIALARIVSGAIRSADVFARWGGEEFVILLPETEAAMALRAAEKLRAAIADAELEIGSVTCSFGAAAFVEGDNAETLVARADLALYRAKRNGRNRVEFADFPATSPTRHESVA